VSRLPVSTERAGGPSLEIAPGVAIGRLPVSKPVDSRDAVARSGRSGTTAALVADDSRAASGSEASNRPLLDGSVDCNASAALCGRRLS
jgi:hypothetical protein